MISRSTEYAIRALAYMAKQGEEDLYLNKDIARQLGLPSPFLTKLLRTLTQEKILISQRGRAGGFRLARPASEISLLDIAEPFDRFIAGRGCLLGQDTCSDEAACPIHDRWKDILGGFLTLFESTSVADVAAAIRPDHFPVSHLGIRKFGQGSDT